MIDKINTFWRCHCCQAIVQVCAVSDFMLTYKNIHTGNEKAIHKQIFELEFAEIGIDDVVAEEGIV